MATIHKDRFEGRVAFVNGAAGGIGQTTAQGFA
jgi:NAD(P)-dependent dehydrogenase (short-subunit alcohol dehydrogenase family)